ncbi:unnamed protein product [Leptidea sinapis]|uniref:NADH dehydrogenase [ubiquinone] 1 beta subcomplex subunit 4 n=1 Tax=Leptidea sinapis TaxID=189913 RepID=A0A5E4PPW8_9NEOP|nr:unnamed protein product [Leptidea sinapis]
MAEKYGISEAEYAVIQKQAARRAEMRREFLKQRTNPFKHSTQSGYVFDEGLQRFMSMKATQYEFFKPSRSSAIFGITAVLVPMFVYGYAIYKERSTREHKYRTGEIRYRERTFKLC